MKKLILFIVIFTSLSAHGLDMASLAATLDSIQFYTDSFRSKLTDERSELNNGENAEDRIRAMVDLSNLYRLQDPDSSLFYMRKARDLASENIGDSISFLLNLRSVTLMPLTGMAGEADRAFEQIEVPERDSFLYRAYCLTGMRMYLNTLKMYPNGAEYDSISSKAIRMGEKFLSIPNLSERERVGTEAVIYYLRGDYDQAAAASLEVLPLVSDDWVATHYYGRRVLEYYRAKVGRRQQYLEQLFGLSQAMMRQGIIDGALMAELGDALFELNHQDLAQDCYGVALLALSGEPSRFREHSQTRQMLDSRYEKIIDFEARSQVILYVLIIASIVLGSLVIILFILYMRARRQKTAPEAQGSVSPMVELSFEVLNRTRDFNTLIDRKLTAGQSHELYSDIHSGRLIKEITDGFFEEFDRLLLKSEPDFIQRLNALLLPDKQFDVSPDGRLNPELRIAALIRYGVDDSTRLSRILGLSLNTIYTYRNRLRGRAIDRNSFESALASL